MAPPVSVGIPLQLTGEHSILSYWVLRANIRFIFQAMITRLHSNCRPQNCERNAPRNCWHTILTCGNPEWYGKPLKQRGFPPRQADIRRGTGASRIVFLLGG